MSGMTAERRLILFGRYPVPGRTKTRLITVLGPLGAAEIQRQWTERAVATLQGAHLAPLTFVYAGGTVDQVRRWLGSTRIELAPQADGDLGLRMQMAITDALGKGAQQVVLLGTDVPGMAARHVTRAFDALADHDLVLGPSRDGGYWLVGCRHPAPVFRGIAWGTGAVLQQTLTLARQNGLSVALLPVMDDIDTPEDLMAMRPAHHGYRPYLSVVIPTLNEAERIGATVGDLIGPDIEVIVADGGSRDPTRTIARNAGAMVLATTPGRGVQQNAGARQSRGRILLFLHADTRLPCDFGHQVFECLMDPGVGWGAFQFQTDWDHWAMRWVARAANARTRWLHLPYGDQGVFMRRHLFEKAGGFPPAPIAEDLYLARRLSRLGRIALAPGTAVTSSRRWRRIGIMRTTLINTLVAAGCLLGIDPARLAHLYDR